MANEVSASQSRELTQTIGVFLVGLGTLVLAGWTFDIPVLKSVFGGGISMKANAAVAIAASGIALALLVHDSRWRVAGRLAALLAGTIAGLTLAEHLTGWNFGIDEALFREEPGAPGTTSPGRMGPNASLSLTLGSIALFNLYQGSARAVARAQVIAACIAALATVPLVGYLYGTTELYAVARYTGIAAHTGVALFALSLGLLAARPDVGPVRALATEAPHGVMARRLLVQSFVLPLVLGYLRLEGERRGWYDAAFGTGLFVVVMIVLLSATTWRTAVALSRSSEARRQAQEDRDELLVRERLARQAAERADRAKDAFLANLSHELRTPLNAVTGWTYMLQDPSLAGDARDRAIEAIARNAGAMSRLIEDLLDASRIATGNLEISRAPVDMNAVAEAAVESMMPAAVAKRVGVMIARAPADAWVSGDAQRLQQVLRNVLANAVKFSVPGGNVSVEVIVDDPSVLVRVRDDGEGIAPDFLPHVFDQFKQGSTAPRSNGSLGLGLHIARHLVERHGGHITAESRGLGAGAVFTIQLPAEVSALQTTA